MSNRIKCGQVALTLRLLLTAVLSSCNGPVSVARFSFFCLGSHIGFKWNFGNLASSTSSVSRFKRYFHNLVSSSSSFVFIFCWQLLPHLLTESKAYLSIR